VNTGYKGFPSRNDGVKNRCNKNTIVMQSFELRTVLNNRTENQFESVTEEAASCSEEVAEEQQIPRKRFRKYEHEITN
jgi:hypothetical protein